VTDFRRIPNALIADLAGVISDHHTHAQIDMIFERDLVAGDLKSMRPDTLWWRRNELVVGVAAP
jgi:hypothetical protein